MQNMHNNSLKLSPASLSAMLIGMILIFVFFPGSVAYAVVTDNGSPSDINVTAASATWSHTVNSGINRALFVEIGTTNSAQATAITYAGLSLTRIFRRASASGVDGVEMWVVVAPPVGTANVVVTFSASNSAICGATTFNGVKQSAPYGAFNSASGSSVANILGLFNVSLTVASAPGDMVIDIENWASLLSLSLGHSAGQRELWWNSALVLLGIIGGTTEKDGAASVTMSSNGISLLSIPYVMGVLSITASPPMTLSGTVFEDVNYGGGAGRDRISAGGVGRPGARVELYDSVGIFISSTTTDASGVYTFSALSTGTYIVRVVNDTVSSSRPGYIAGLLPVQTYRTDVSSGTPVGVTDRVGGEAPDKIDSVNGVVNLTVITTATRVPQSITTVTLTEVDVSGVDFGFNFDTIVNKNDTGQGSLSQFINNSSTLGNAGLAQVGQVAGNEVSIFMIPDGNAHPGLRSGIVNQLTGGVAVIQATTVLPTIIGNNTVIDGTTQTANVGNTNLNGLEVEISGNGVIDSGLTINGTFGVTVKAVAIHGFAGSVTNGSGIYVFNADSTAIYGCYLGTNASGAAALANSASGIAVGGTATSTTIGGVYSGEGNLIANNSEHGIHLDSLGTGTAIRGNIIRGNGQSGIYSASVGVLIAKNIINNNGGGTFDGIFLDSGSSNAKVYQNTVHGNGRDGIRVGDVGAIIKNNIFTGNSGYGINRTAASMTESYNDVTDALTAPANVLGRSNVTLDSSDLNVNPLYINAAGFNFNLTECTSPVINQGIDLAADQPDMNGAAAGLWNNNAPEMGALETSSSCAPSLTIVKQAWELSGTGPYTTLSAPVGATIAYLIYVKNTTAGPVNDLRINDALNETAFQYVAGSLVRTSAASPPSDSATDLVIFNATASGTGTIVTDGVDGDVASAQDTGGATGVDRITIGAVSGQANAALAVNGHSTFGIRFNVKIK